MVRRLTIDGKTFYFHLSPSEISLALPLWEEVFRISTVVVETCRGYVCRNATPLLYPEGVTSMMTTPGQIAPGVFFSIALQPGATQRPSAFGATAVEFSRQQGGHGSRKLGMMWAGTTHSRSLPFVRPSAHPPVRLSVYFVVPPPPLCTPS